MSSWNTPFNCKIINHHEESVIHANLTDNSERIWISEKLSLLWRAWHVASFSTQWATSHIRKRCFLKGVDQINTARLPVLSKGEIWGKQSLSQCFGKVGISWGKVIKVFFIQPTKKCQHKLRKLYIPCFLCHHNISSNVCWAQKGRAWKCLLQKHILDSIFPGPCSQSPWSVFC